MKSLAGGEFLTAPLAVKISAFALVFFAFFYLGKQWSESGGYDQIVFFSRPDPLPSIALSSNSNKTFNYPSLVNSSENSAPPSAPPIPEPSPPSDPPPPPSPPSPPPPARLGLVDETGAMREDFDVGALDPDVAESFGNENGTVREAAHGDSNSENFVFKLKKFPVCAESMREYIPCLDNLEAIKKLKSTEKGEQYERHCPKPGKGLDCLVPPPKNYKTPIPWPKSRDEVWYNNVPHTRLVEDKGGQNWISKSKEKFKFPGGGTQFIHGANQYLDQMSQMVPGIKFGRHTRVVLDVGCGVASFGAFILSRKVAPLSIAPKDVHENQIQFALERGVPAMVATFATRRLLYPSQAFDLIHCSRCRINWTHDDGILLLEVNRMLRAGGYFAWAAQPVYKHKDAQQEAWKALWWESHGYDTPELMRFAIRVLSLTCSATGCERNWSVFDQIHSKRRNRLEQKRLNALVFVKYNLQLEQRELLRHDHHDMDPICLSDMESDDEWITEKEDPTFSEEAEQNMWMEVSECFVTKDLEATLRHPKKKSHEMEDLTNRMCWELVNKEGYIAIWKKPLNNSCYLSRDAGVKPPLCDTDDNPDNVWYVDLKPCISRLPDNGFGGNITTWPDRLHYPPDRLQNVEMDAYQAKKELFKAESKYWNDIVGSFIRAYHWKKLKLRNVMDMRAGFGGFATAMIDLGMESWVMNVVPISGPNTLPVIYDRGLIGVLHDWCEPFDTYPRTYDLLHAAGLFSVEQKRCDISSILLEMDRILRPGGRAYIRDSKYVIEKVQKIAMAMGWRAVIHDTSEGPYSSRRVLRCEK